MDPKRITTLFLVVGAIGMVALAVEWLRIRMNGWLALIIMSLILLVSALMLQHARAHDHDRPELVPWLKELKSKARELCCNGNDTDKIDDWETRPGGFKVKFRGTWYDVPDTALVEGPNISGGPLLWMNKGYLGVSVRCFMPGPLT